MTSSLCFLTLSFEPPFLLVRRDLGLDTLGRLDICLSLLLLLLGFFDPLFLRKLLLDILRLFVALPSDFLM